jgi:hypothetical protein
MRCVRPLPDALQTAGQVRRNFVAPKWILSQYRMNGVYRHIQYSTVIPSTSWFPEWSLSPPKSWHVSLFPARVSLPRTCHKPQYWVRDTNNDKAALRCTIKHNRHHPSAFEGVKFVQKCGLNPLPRCSVRSRRQLAASPII